MKWVLLPTDAVMGLLLVMVILYGLWVRREPTRLAAWSRVFSRPSAAVATTILVFFTGVALLDSFHFRLALPPAPDGTAVYSPVTRSALEYLVRDQLDAAAPERSYSEPFALREFDKSTVVTPTGRVRDFQPLKTPQAHPATTSELLLRGALGAAAGVLVAALLIVAWRAATRGKDAKTGSMSPAAKGSAWTLVILCLIAGMLLAVWPSRHPMGTDAVGNDVLLSALQSLRTALVIGTLATLSTLPFAVSLGIAAGYFKGWVDDVIQYLYTTLSSIPGVLLIAATVLMIQSYMDSHPDLWQTGLERADVKLFLLAVIIGLTGWATLARLLRAETIKLSTLDYVRAAQALGVGPLTIMWRHILPNVLHIVLIVAVLDFSGIVLYEAVLSYVGVGVDPSMNSFGTMINAARSEMSRSPMVWWNLGAAFLFMLALVLSANLLAAAVRDAFDPRATHWQAGAKKKRVKPNAQTIKKEVSHESV